MWGNKPRQPLDKIIFPPKSLNNLLCEAVNNLTHNLWQSRLANSKLGVLIFLLQPKAGALYGEFSTEN